MLLFITTIFVVLTLACNNGQHHQYRDLQKERELAPQGNGNDRNGRESGLADYELSEEAAIDSVMQKVLEITRPHLRKNVYTDSFSNTIDSLYQIYTTVSLKRWFAPSVKHLIIHSKANSSVAIHIFKIEGKQLHRVLTYGSWELTYVSDTLQDVNGDGHKDFLVNWYGSSGCCLKNFYDVFLYQADSGNFSHQIQFINPSFSAREQIIRGVCYGHPGETSLYKYKWKGTGIDTIEYIHPDPEKKGWYIRANTFAYRNKKVKTERLASVPAEYRGIYGFDWFRNKLND